MAYLRIKHFIKTRPVTHSYQIKWNNGAWQVIEERTREIVGAFRTEQEACQFMPQTGAKPL